MYSIIFYVVTFALTQMQPLSEKIMKEAPPTARIIACRFQFPRWTPSVKFEAGPHSVFMYDNVIAQK